MKENLIQNPQPKPKEEWRIFKVFKSASEALSPTQLYNYPYIDAVASLDHDITKNFIESSDKSFKIKL